MTGTKGTYSRLAEAIQDFSVHRLNKLELYEIVATCILESTPEDKEMVFSKDEFIRTDFHIARNWLIKK